MESCLILKVGSFGGESQWKKTYSNIKRAYEEEEEEEEEEKEEAILR